MLASSTQSSPTVPDSPLIFPCPSCDQDISAPASMAGQVVACPLCHQQFTVPPPAAPQAAAHDEARIREEIRSLEGQLHENVTQTTELRGNMSRLNMELHRHQLRLDKLLERQTSLNTEIQAARDQLSE